MTLTRAHDGRAPNEIRLSSLLSGGGSASCVAILSLLAACTPSTRSSQWNEEVLLSSGEHVWIERRISMRRVSQPGNPFLYRYSKLEENVVRLKDHPDQPWRGGFSPIVLDRVGDRWVVVFTLSGYVECEKYDFPREGLAVFALEGSGWTRVRFDDVVSRLQINLGSPDLRRIGDPLPPLTMAEKAGRSAARVGMELRDFVPHLQRLQDSCIKIRPPPDPFRQASLAEFARLPFVSGNALVATVNSEPRTIDREEAIRLLGEWSGSAWIQNCERLVTTESVHEWSRSGGGVRSRLVEKALKVSVDGTFRPVAYWPDAAWLLSVICAGDRIYALFRPQLRELRIVEYDTGGQLLRGWRYALPDLSPWLGKSRGHHVNFVDEERAFSLSLLDYQYKGLVYDGGAIVHEITLTLPKK